MKATVAHGGAAQCREGVVRVHVRLVGPRHPLHGARLAFVAQVFAAYAGDGAPQVVLCLHAVGVHVLFAVADLGQRPADARVVVRLERRDVGAQLAAGLGGRVERGRE